MHSSFCPGAATNCDCRPGLVARTARRSSGTGRGQAVPYGARCVAGLPPPLPLSLRATWGQLPPRPMGNSARRVTMQTRPRTQSAYQFKPTCLGMAGGRILGPIHAVYTVYTHNTHPYVYMRIYGIHIYIIYGIYARGIYRIHIYTLYAFLPSLHMPGGVQAGRGTQAGRLPAYIHIHRHVTGT